MSNNPFADHGVEYLSPTSINKFARSPAKWLVNIAGYKDRMYKPAFTYGNAIEQGITAAVMQDVSINEAIEIAMDEFTKVQQKIGLVNSYKYDFEMANKKQLQVARVLTEIIPQYKKLGVPVDAQRWVEWECDDLPIPIRGILDLEYEDCVRDLKTTSVRPKAPSIDYCRQLTFYALATNKAPMVDYVYTLSKSQELISFDIDNVNMYVNDIKRIAFKMMRMLSLSSEIEDVCYLSNLEPDLSGTNFYDIWGANETIGANKLFMY
tara:strand:+ start:11430 stop:12224 length:795 start_codon:yes stop_codon:yes gene_type:complete